MRVQLVGHKTYATMNAVYHSGQAYELPDELGEQLLTHRTDEGGDVFAEVNSVAVEVGLEEPKRPAAHVTKRIVIGGKTNVAASVPTPPAPPAPPAGEESKGTAEI